MLNPGLDEATALSVMIRVLKLKSIAKSLDYQDYHGASLVQAVIHSDAWRPGVSVEDLPHAGHAEDIEPKSSRLDGSLGQSY